MKSYTDLEQSKILSEIIPIESADMYYHYIVGVDSYYDKVPRYIQVFNHFAFFHSDIPCWSLATLMDMLPSEFTEKGKYSETTYKIHIRKYALTEDVDLYQIAYGNYHWHDDGSCSWSDMINTGEKENLIDAVFQMICWLKKMKSYEKLYRYRTVKGS